MYFRTNEDRYLCSCTSIEYLHSKVQYDTFDIRKYFISKVRKYEGTKVHYTYVYCTTLHCTALVVDQEKSSAADTCRRLEKHWNVRPFQVLRRSYEISTISLQVLRKLCPFFRPLERCIFITFGLWLPFPYQPHPPTFIRWQVAAVFCSASGRTENLVSVRGAMYRSSFCFFLHVGISKNHSFVTTTSSYPDEGLVSLRRVKKYIFSFTVLLLNSLLSLYPLLPRTLG